jgi:hypothetical protein
MQVCNIIEKLIPQANRDNYEVTVFADGHWEITKWKLDVPQPSVDKILAASNAIDLDNAKQTKINELDQACKNSILANFTATLNGVDYEFSYDAESQSRFNGLGILFLNNLISEVPWTAYQNGERVRITLTKDDFNTISLAALKHQNDNVTKYSNLYNQAMTAPSTSIISQITW